MNGGDVRARGRRWAWGIAATYGVFVVLTLTMVALAFTRDVHLVSEDYYEREIEHQKHIERVARTNALPEELRWTFASEAEGYVFRFPATSPEVKIAGRIHFYRPDDATLDRIVGIALDEEGRQCVAASLIAPGRWHVRIEWQSAGLDYYDEFRLLVRNG